MTVTAATPSSIAAKELLILYPTTALKRNFCYNSSINLTSGYRPVSFRLASGPDYRERKEIGRTLCKSHKLLETTEIDKAALPHYYMTGTVCPVRNPHLAAIDLVLEIPFTSSTSSTLVQVMPENYHYQQGDYINGTIIVRPKEDMVLDTIAITIESSRMKRKQQVPLEQYVVMDQVLPSDRILLTGFEYSFSVSFQLVLPNESTNQVFLRTALMRVVTPGMSRHTKLCVSVLTALRVIPNDDSVPCSYISIINDIVNYNSIISTSSSSKEISSSSHSNNLG